MSAYRRVPVCSSRVAGPREETTTEAGPSVEKPTAAGIYDVYLGGSDNTEAERAAAEQLRRVLPYAATRNTIRPLRYRFGD